MTITKAPEKQGLYDPSSEHAGCGVGFLAHLKGCRSHDIVHSALGMLQNLNHRGACGCEANSGDGAGILLQLPDRFFRSAWAEKGVILPEPLRYGVAMLFTSPDPRSKKVSALLLEDVVREQGAEPIGWREVPTDNSSLGEAARGGEPCIRQLFIALKPGSDGAQDLERRLYLIRRMAEVRVRQSGCDPLFYVASLSCRTIVYKGMLTPSQLARYFPELEDPLVESALALVHSRFSTNTFPSWHRAHPYRLLAHNGEINTLRGNVNWMQARESRLLAPNLGGNYASASLGPVIDQDGSDSAMFDNALELLVMAGRSLPHAVMMMIPEAWENHEEMGPELKAFYQYQAGLMEPWDGPAAIAFTDGRSLGAVLDRNGLRPLRFCLTRDDLVVLSSEAGALPLDPQRIIRKGRVRPGQLFYADLQAGRIVEDKELKRLVAGQSPYQSWLSIRQLPLEALPVPDARPLTCSPLIQLQIAFGYTYEELRLILEPMVLNGQQPVGSMAVDIPPAVFSDKPQLLYNYFRQHFAQVTNPPIDPIREELFTSTVTFLGKRGNLLEESPESAQLIRLPHPLLTNAELEKLRGIDHPGFQARALSLLYRSAGGSGNLEQAMEALCAQAHRAAVEGCNLLILSDRAVDRTHLPIPALLAVSGVHHHLIRAGSRTLTSIVVESGEPREVHHVAALLGYGADAINPYLALRTVAELAREGTLAGIDAEKAQSSYLKALLKGVVKTMAKMGISTLQGYRGAQTFEALGIAGEVIERYFTHTASRIGGMTLPDLAREVALRHRAAFGQRQWVTKTLDSGGVYQWRDQGEEHLIDPRSVYALQKAVRTGDYREFRTFSRLNDGWVAKNTLRGLLEFKETSPIPLEEVEPVREIVKRFKTGAMSYGSISREAHETIAQAMNLLGGMSNTGEGGEDPERFSWRGQGGESRNSAIKQVASARFGVTSHYLSCAREIQIKMAQGAKPGEGGELPGVKVFPQIAKTRNTTAGVGLISPPPHHDIYSIEDLAQLIYDLKCANRRARISVKLVSKSGVGTIAAGVAKARADVILISGCDGGTGASPLSSIRHAGLPFEIGLAETHQTLILNGLRERVVLETDGQLRTGRDVALAALLGAEEFGFSTGPLVALGCLMMRVCHLNTCPVGIATQHPDLRKRFTGRPEHVVRFMEFVACELREIMARLGVATVAEMVGRSDLLTVRSIEKAKARGIDLSSLLHRPSVPPSGRGFRSAQDHGLETTLDLSVLLELTRPALDRREPVRETLPIANRHRAVGTIVGNEVTLRYGAQGLPDDTIHLCFQGSAGQSFGAFLPRGVTLELEGEANDYLAKGLSGGRIILYPPRNSPFTAAKNIITGNVAAYGATSGEIFACGQAGERFCVRNSGATAVVEGAGDHCCEYMTGGVVAVLGQTGRNFAAGMSGGIAYVLDENGTLARRCHDPGVTLTRLDPTDQEGLEKLLSRHRACTGSSRAEELLSRWEEILPRFVKVIPNDYRNMLAAVEKARQTGLEGDQALEAAFAEEHGRKG